MLPVWKEGKESVVSCAEVRALNERKENICKGGYIIWRPNMNNGNRESGKHVSLLISRVS
jgi:hypothetical protein